MSRENCFILDADVRFLLPETVTKPVRHGVDILFRDIEKVLGHQPLTTATRELATIVVQYTAADDPVKSRPEAFGLRFETNPANGYAQMIVAGSDDLGIIYGLLYISREYLGISPFWFWVDQQVQPRKFVEIPMEDYLSPEAKVRFRGWFVNDEVCLIGWTDIYPPPREVWFPVFEALLRCGGNMVIPGTDLPREGGHWEFATEMGLYITHHHAEPLGAEMFLRAYPDRRASFNQHPELYEGLWEEAVRRRKADPVIWALGFRGDCPFWEQDPSLDTPQSRGELISRAIRKQYELVQKYVKNPVFATYLYGELSCIGMVFWISLKGGKVFIEEVFRNFCSQYFPAAPEKVAPCYATYFQKTIQYGVNLNDRSGEQYYHHLARSIIRHWLLGKAESIDHIMDFLAVTSMLNMLFV